MHTKRYSKKCENIHKITFFFKDGTIINKRIECFTCRRFMPPKGNMNLFKSVVNDYNIMYKLKV